MVKYNTVILSEDPTFGNCKGLYKLLRRKDKRTRIIAIFNKEDRKGEFNSKWAQLGFKNIPDADKYFVVSGLAFDRLIKEHDFELPQKKTTVILTDSHYRLNSEEMNNMLKGYTVFAMADLLPLGLPSWKVYYHPYQLNPQTTKNPFFTISHSPYTKYIDKGTDYVINAVRKLREKYPVKLDIITGVTQEESIQRKSRAHIFIDQIVNQNNGLWKGGLGKSGIEGMATECCTFTTGITSCDHYPAPPIINTSIETLYDDLLYYIEHPVKRRNKAADQKKWVIDNLNYTTQFHYLNGDN